MGFQLGEVWNGVLNPSYLASRPPFVLYRTIVIRMFMSTLRMFVSQCILFCERVFCILLSLSFLHFALESTCKPILTFNHSLLVLHLPLILHQRNNLVPIQLRPYFYTTSPGESTINSSF